MGFQPFHVHYEQRTSTTTNERKVIFNTTYVPIKVDSHFKLKHLRAKLANVSIPAARKAYNNDPDHLQGFEDTEHEGKWKFHFVDSLGKEEKTGELVMDRSLDEEGFEILTNELGGMSRTWRSARIWHVSQSLVLTKALRGIRY